MYAIVKFSDEEKTRIVALDDIKNFNENLIQKKKFLVKFTDGHYYSAHVVVVKDTIEELEIYQKQTRLRFVNSSILDSATSAVESETDDQSETFLNKPSVSQNKSVKVVLEKKERKSNIRLSNAERKNQQEFLVKHKKNREPSESKHREQTEKDYSKKSKSHSLLPLNYMSDDDEFDDQNDNCKKCGTKLQNLEMKIEDLKLQNKELLTLNIDLQKSVIDHFKNLPGKLFNEQENEVAIGGMVNNQVHLGRGVYISKESYNDAWFRSSTAPQFVKSIAVYVFGAQTLASSSVTGKSSNYYKKEVTRPALDATKLAAIEDIFKHVLKEKHPEQNPLHELKMIRSYISNKISDLNRNKEMRKKKSVRQVVESEASEKPNEDNGTENNESDDNGTDKNDKSEDSDNGSE